MEAIMVALIEKLSFVQLLILAIVLLPVGVAIIGIRRMIRICIGYVTKLDKQATKQMNLEGRVEEVERIANGVSKALWGVQKDLNAIRGQTAELKGIMYGSKDKRDIRKQH